MPGLLSGSEGHYCSPASSFPKAAVPSSRYQVFGLIFDGSGLLLLVLEG